MMHLVRQKWFLIVGAAAVGLAAVGIYFLYLFLRGDDFLSDNPATYRALSVSPTSTTVLQPGARATFEVVFSGPVEESNIVASVTWARITGDTGVVAVPVEVTLDDNRRILRVVTGALVETYSTYTLTVVNKVTGALLLQESYRSSLHDMTPAPVNNLDLLPFLPHETTSYRLSYLPELNIYVFNLKYDPTVPGPILDQYDRARAEAEAFIRESGVNPESIVIEWRHS